MNRSECFGDVNMTMWRDFMEESIVVGQHFKVIYTIGMSFVLIISLAVNPLICVVIYFDKTMHTVTNYYLFSLAISDITLTFGLIFLLLHEQFHIKAFSEVACKIQFFGIISLWNYSILTMTALSIERYIAICHPLKVKGQKLRRVMKIIAFLWLIAVAETAPEISSIVMVKVEPYQSLICFSVPTAFARVVNGVLAILTFFIPLLIITSAYIMIVLRVNLRRWRDLSSGSSNYRSPRGKINKLIVAMSVAFLVCWLPHFIVRILFAVLEPNRLIDKTKWWTLIFKLVTITGWFCVILNPIIFSLASTKFKRALKRLWNSKVRKRLNT